MTITVSTTDKRDGKALALFARCAGVAAGQDEGRPLVLRDPRQRAGLSTWPTRTTARAPTASARRKVCKHMRAVRFWMAAFGPAPWLPSHGPPPPRWMSELVILTPEGAAALAEDAERARDLGLATDAEIDVIFAASPPMHDTSGG